MKCFGSKWSASRSGRYPDPAFNVIAELFAGGAGYACRHHECGIYINEGHGELLELWRWLIEEARESDIRDLPILPPGVDLSALGLSLGQALLIKWWQRTNNHGTKTWLTSPWGDKPGQWTPNTRSRVASEVEAIKHWKLGVPSSHEQFTAFIDPPYQFNFGYCTPKIDYSQLASSALKLAARRCQVIVCEAIGPKGETPTYLPFSQSHLQVTSRRKSEQSHHSRELICIL